MIDRWWQYQKERFPLMGHGLLVFVLCASALAVSTLLRGQTVFPDTEIIAGAFVSALTLFFHLRIADEFKDREEDLRHRPHLPVPRGLISLRELYIAAIVCGVIQIAIALSIEPALIIILLIVWLYMALMTKEFFLREWLKSRLLVYMLSHMPIIPLIAIYISAFDWLVDKMPPPAGLGWLVIISYFVGIVLEIGRKIRAPDHEISGVTTYSSAWGIHTSSIAWLGALCLASLATLPLAYSISFLVPMAVVMSLVMTTGVWVVIGFIKNPKSESAKWIEHVSAAAILVLYLGIGPLTILFQLIAI